MRALAFILALVASAHADEKPIFRVKACEMIRIEPVAFPQNRAEIAARQARALDELAGQLRRPELLSVEVSGHATKGEHRRNPELARTRAEAVIEALVARGVDRSRLKLAGVMGHARRPCVDFASALVNTPEQIVSPQYRRHSFVVLRGCDEP